ncbi:MAG: LCP family protein [Clostridia bacterium]|nr:LCP family protein [Clostridia bacterium]
MGKHESSKKDKPPRKKGRVLSVILIAVFTALILGAIYIMKPPEQLLPPDPGRSEGIPQPGQPSLPNGSGGSADPDGSGGSIDTDPTPPRELKDKFYTFLIAGTNDNYNTDTLMLGSIDMNTLKVNLVSIPRDTMVDVPAKIKRINGAYGRDGIEELCREVAEVTGVYPQYYALINVRSFTKIVDLVGGVDFYVPYRMYHPDAQEEYTIDLQKGQQRLTSKKALQLVRFRGTSQNDFGRIELQKKFLLATLKQVKNEFSLDKIQDMISVINESIKTNMNTQEMIWFYLNAANKMNYDEDITFHTMPYADTGKYQGQDYVYLDAEKVVELMNATVNPYTTDLTEDDVHIIRLEN